MVDSMNNEACLKFGAYPQKLFVIYKSRVAFSSGPGPNGYDIGAVTDWLNDYEINDYNVRKRVWQGPVG